MSAADRPTAVLDPSSRALGYERIAASVQDAILSGRLKPGERLSPVRQMARQLGVSGATVAAAYDLLARRGWTRGEVGRGTFVAPHHPGGAVSAARLTIQRGHVVAAPVPWRRRAINALVARLRTAYPHALDCTTARPDSALLPHPLLIAAWHAALAETSPADLQYAGPDPTAPLLRQILPRLAADGVPAAAGDLAVGNSAQQLLMLALDVVDSRVASTGGPRRIAVEEPGFYTAYDTCERRGYELVGLAVDSHGAVPESLQAALETGISAVLLTPRAHNPTGASWTPERATALAATLAPHTGVLVIEDDYSGVADARPGSLLADPRVADRVIHVRSFSKSIAPDLRVAVAVARPTLRAALVEAKSYADGWTSCLTQRVLARVLGDPSLDDALRTARNVYAKRRAALVAALNARLQGAGEAIPAADGVNVWIRLPTGADSARVVELAAARGALFAPSEPFFIRPGHVGAVRLNAGAILPERAEHVAAILAGAALDPAGAAPHAMI